jgi:chaperone required for assembly of F1-ATPase
MDDPGKTAAAKPSAANLPKRFYKRVDVADRDGGFALLLDGKPVRMPGKKQLLLPSRGRSGCRGVAGAKGAHRPRRHAADQARQ